MENKQFFYLNLLVTENRHENQFVVLEVWSWSTVKVQRLKYQHSGFLWSIKWIVFIGNTLLSMEM